MKILLVFNPWACHKRAAKWLPEIEAAFIKYGVEFDLSLTDYPEHGIEIVAQADLTQYDGIVAAGGDGTLFEVINGYYRNHRSKDIPLGILPIGTGNAFARDLNLDAGHWPEAVRIISEGKLRNVDVGHFKSHGQDYYFLNILGVGFVADVTKAASKLKFFGNLSYTLGVFYRTIRLKADQMQVTVDGKLIERACTFVEISNTRYTSNFLMAPQARIDDGLLDITIAGKLGRLKLLKSFPKIFTGDHIYLDEVETCQAQTIKIETSTAKVLTPDGELVGITPVEINCLAAAIRVFWR